MADIQRRSCRSGYRNCTGNIGAPVNAHLRGRSWQCWPKLGPCSKAMIRRIGLKRAISALAVGPLQSFGDNH